MSSTLLSSEGEAGNVSGGILGGRPSCTSGRCEGVGTMVEHELGTVVGMGSGLDAQVAEHGLGFPKSKELDGVRVHSGTEQGCGPTRPQ